MNKLNDIKKDFRDKAKNKGVDLKDPQKLSRFLKKEKKNYEKE